MKRLFTVLAIAFVAAQIHALSLEIDANAVLSSESSYSYTSYLGDMQLMSASARQTIGSSPLGLEITVSVPFFSMSKFAYGMSVDTGCSVSRSFKQEDKNNLMRYIFNSYGSGSGSNPYWSLSPQVINPYDDNEIPLDDNTECVNTNFFASISPMIRFSPAERHSITITPGILLEAIISRSTGKLALAPENSAIPGGGYTVVRRSEQVVTMDYAANLGLSYKYWFLMKKYFKMGVNAGVNLMVPISGSVVKTGGYSTGVYEVERGDKVNAKLLLGLAFNFGERNNVGSGSSAGGQAGTAGESDCGCKGCKCPYCTGEKK